MANDFVEQVQYLLARYEELKKKCETAKDEAKVSVEICAATEDILTRAKRLMDQSLHDFFTRKIAPNLPTQKVHAARIYFPVADDAHQLQSTLGRGEMADLSQSHPAVFQFIEGVQPFNAGHEWMRTLNDVATGGHVRLTRQAKKRNHFVSITDAVHITGSVTMRNVNINGYDIEELRVDSEGVKWRAPKPVPVEYKVEVRYVIDGTDINALGLCEQAIQAAKVIEQTLSSH